MTRNEANHLVGWLAIPVMAALNGALRDVTYGKAMNDTVAHSIAVAPLGAAVFLWAFVLDRRWPLGDRRVGMRVGCIWLALTLVAEFGLGAARGTSIDDMLAEYNIARGNLWLLVPLATAVAPELVRRYPAARRAAPEADQ